MKQEQEPPKDPAFRSCRYCEPGIAATWEIISAKGGEFVCDKHHSLLTENNAIQKERLLTEVEWKAYDRYEEDFREHEFDDIDEWENGSMYGF